MTLRGKLSTWIKACLSATFSTTNPNVQAWDWTCTFMMIGCQITAWAMEKAVKYQLQCECVQWLLHVTWHTAKYVTVSQRRCPHMDKLCSLCTTLCVWSAQVATLLTYIIQHMSLIKYNSWQLLNYCICWHWSVIRREFSRTMGCKPNLLN